jgi:hypothetical protein
MKIRPAGAELFHADGQIDVKKFDSRYFAILRTRVTTIQNVWWSQIFGTLTLEVQHDLSIYLSHNFLLHLQRGSTNDAAMQVAQNKALAKRTYLTMGVFLF